MKILIYIIGIVMVSSIAYAITIDELPQITITFDTINDNIASLTDDNIQSVYCNSYIGNICKVYRTSSRHSTLAGE